MRSLGDHKVCPTNCDLLECQDFVLVEADHDAGGMGGGGGRGRGRGRERDGTGEVTTVDRELDGLANDEAVPSDILQSIFITGSISIKVQH